MTPEELAGQAIAAVLMTDDGEAFVVFGTVLVDGGSIVIDCDGGGTLPLTAESLPKVRPVTDEVADLFGDADVWVPLTVGSVTDDEADGMIPTGVNLNRIAAGE